MKKAILSMIVLWLWAAPMSGAETIYTWTDSNGIQRYSTHQPPEGIRDYKKIESPTPSPEASKATEKSRDSYNRMVEEARQESKQRELKRKQEDAARTKKERQKAEAEKQARIQAQRELLEKQIEALENRALSPTYSSGMRQAQIDELRNQIKKLETSPDAHSDQQPAPAPSKNGE